MDIQDDQDNKMSRFNYERAKETSKRKLGLFKAWLLLHYNLCPSKIKIQKHIWGNNK